MNNKANISVSQRHSGADLLPSGESVRRPDPGGDHTDLGEGVHRAGHVLLKPGGAGPQSVQPGGAAGQPGRSQGDGH